MTDIFGSELLSLIFQGFRSSLRKHLEEEMATLSAADRLSSRAQLKYFNLPNFADWLGRSFVGQTTASFWQAPIANSTRRSRTHNGGVAAGDGLNLNLMLFKEMEGFVERFDKPIEATFDDSQVESSHLVLSGLPPNDGTMADRIEDLDKGFDSVLLSGDASFCWTHYNVAHLRALVEKQDAAEEASSAVDKQRYKQCMNRQVKRLHETGRTPRRQNSALCSIMTSSTSNTSSSSTNNNNSTSITTFDYGDALRHIASYILNDSHLVQCDHLWDYIFRDAGRSSLLQMMTSCYDGVVKLERQLITSAIEIAAPTTTIIANNTNTLNSSIDSAQNSSLSSSTSTARLPRPHSQMIYVPSRSSNSQESIYRDEMAREEGELHCSASRHLQTFL